MNFNEVMISIGDKDDNTSPINQSINCRIMLQANLKKIFTCLFFYVSVVSFEWTFIYGNG